MVIWRMQVNSGARNLPRHLLPESAFLIRAIRAQKSADAIR
jgi:hypothetical protein